MVRQLAAEIVDVIVLAVSSVAIIGILLGMVLGVPWWRMWRRPSYIIRRSGRRISITPDRSRPIRQILKLIVIVMLLIVVALIWLAFSAPLSSP